EKLGLAQSGVKVVLEQDGTEVDEEDYFNTLEKNTTLMLLTSEQYWQPPSPFRLRRIDGGSGDTVDGGRGLEGLLSRLQSDIGHVSLLGGCELELLSDMDPDSLTDIVPDSCFRTFLDQLKEASGRFLSDKRQAHEAMELLKLYHHSSTDPAPNAASIQPEPKRGTKAQ
ncbi:hypothetical protein AAG570_008738, partial [Ranatra chinensis]